MGARLVSLYRKQSAMDPGASALRDTPWAGLPLPLEPSEDSPFLGDIKPGTSQAAVETNLFRAPVFRHEVPHSDYLLVRSAKGKMSIRKIDAVAAVGQQVRREG